MTVWATRTDQVDLRGPNPHDLARSPPGAFEVEQCAAAAGTGDMALLGCGLLVPRSPANPVFDDYLLAATAGGIRQVVLLAAGLDTRAFRLPWPDGVCLYELDLMGCAAGGATRAWSAATRHRVEPSYRGQPYRGRVPPMKVDKLSVSFDPDLGDAVRAAARHSGGGVSRWLADAAAAKLRAEALSDFLDAWEAEHGSLTSAELSKAATELALPKPASTEPAA